MCVEIHVRDAAPKRTVLLIKAPLPSGREKTEREAGERQLRRCRQVELPRLDPRGLEGDGGGELLQTDALRHFMRNHEGTEEQSERPALDAKILPDVDDATRRNFSTPRLTPVRRQRR